MKKFLSSLFNSKAKENDSVITFEILDKIYSYLYYENSNVSFKQKGFFDKIYVNRYNFPDSFDNPKKKSEVKSCGYSSVYQVLNELFSKIDIDPLSQDLIDENYPVDFIHIQFFSNTKGMNAVTKNILQNFIIFFCCDNGSADSNSFRILYSNNRYFTFFIRNLLDTKYIKKNIPEIDIEKIAFKDFETVLMGICQHLGIELPKTIACPNLLFEEVTQAHFEEFLNLITRDEIADESIKKQSKKMFSKYKKATEEYDFIENNFEFLEHINCWNSDWKFSADDVTYFISEIINQEFVFDYPEETYSHELFPYIQKALAKLDLALMSFDTQGDNYLFFVVNKKEIDRVVDLSQMIGVSIDEL